MIIIVVRFVYYYIMGTCSLDLDPRLQRPENANSGGVQLRSFFTEQKRVRSNSRGLSIRKIKYPFEVAIFIVNRRIF